MSADRALELLGLMRRAGKLELGEIERGAPPSGNAGQNCCCWRRTPEANARDRAEGFSAGHRVPLVELPVYERCAVRRSGKANTVMAAVTDAGFAKALEKCLDGNDAAARQPHSGKTTGNERSDA